MNESVVKKLFEKHCAGANMIINKNVSAEDGTVDYEIVFSEKRFGVEAKGTRSDVYSTIGQLLNAKRTYSHVYLLAPAGFIKKIWGILQETKTLTSVGLMAVGTDGVHIIKKPDSEIYYYKPPTKPPTKPTKKHILVNETDISIETHFKSQPFTVSDIAKHLNKPMADAYHRIARLKSAGMIEEVSRNTNPKTYRFVKSRNTNEKIELQHH